MTDAENMRRIRGGVGTYNTKAVSKIDANLAVGEYGLGVTIPAGSIVIGAYIKNVDNDLDGDATTTVGLKAGATALVTNAVVANLKGKALGGAIADGVFVAEDTDLTLSIAVKPATAGTLEAGILYM